MASQLLELPREIRDMISSIVIIDNNDQAFHLNGKSTSGLSSNTSSGLASTCKQLQAEYSYLLRKAALTPGTKIVVPVHDFDFSQLISFVNTLRPHEIKTASRNGNIVVNLVNLQSMASLRTKQQQDLYNWIESCQHTGIEVTYTAQWSSIDTKYLQSLQAMLDTTREGRKIVKALAAKNIKSWSWDSWQAGLLQQRTQKGDQRPAPSRACWTTAK
ncbi:hypothetical protein CB0940_02442 [Cercospora beticola]|uniref:Uncharacterized protein n=1 Tax=Cercospora beticola TaxID=122368 RepID=A0A2G5I256_CERBT|nr:hypothetical protein CB0940_02442 [Cercospora beticola]PIA98877.1 hypothetical protein CB0940_02442 [Cercospora beticola]WPA99576.1 hypothetical protein RHO25_004194 [Cercospora beticola]CAK1362286.1 unnamed protein product [Cercospora beticola]